MAAPANVGGQAAGDVDEELDLLLGESEDATLAAQAFLQIVQAALLAGKRLREAEDGDEEAVVKVRRNRDLRSKPGRGHSVLGQREAYVRGASRQVYDNIRHSHHPALFSVIVHFCPDGFDHIFDIVGRTS